MGQEDIKRVAVVGAGLMGHGIAQEFALAGYQVRINDLTDEKLQQALDNIGNNLRYMETMGLVTREQMELVPPRIHPSLSLEETVADADYVAEAVYEILSLKQEVFADIDRMCPKNAILASNTSTLMPSVLGSAIERPERLLVAHYINPPFLMPIVEVIRGSETSDEVVDTVVDLLTGIGKRPIALKREVPGFIVNRLQAALFREAASLVDKGVATVEDVDAIVSGSFGRRLALGGPFRTWEMGGWDTILKVVKEIIEDIDGSPEVPKLLRETVERGDFGPKTGKGFYEWTPETTAAMKEKIAQMSIAAEKISRSNP